MSLLLYLDDCVYAKRLVRALAGRRAHGGNPGGSGATGVTDHAHLLYAATHGLLLITRDPDDFLTLHVGNTSHSGILGIYQDNDPRRDMTYGEVVRAIANLEASGVPLAGAFHVLNAWRY